MEVLHQCTIKETDHILIVPNHETAEQGDLRVKYSIYKNEGLVSVV